MVPRCGHGHGHWTFVSAPCPACVDQFYDFSHLVPPLPRWRSPPGLCFSLVSSSQSTVSPNPQPGLAQLAPKQSTGRRL